MSCAFTMRLISAMFFAAAVGCVTCFAIAEVTLKPRIVQLDTFEVVGIEVRTNNTKEASADGLIPKLWQRVTREHVLDNVPDKTEQNIYAVYTDYASDANGEYTFVLGAKVRPGTKPHAGLVVKTVPGARYAVFTWERGPVAKVVVETWKQIWSYYQTPANGQRSYRADFELYDQRSSDPNSAQVDIYIGVSSK